MKISVCCTGFWWDVCGVGLGLHALCRFVCSSRDWAPQSHQLPPNCSQTLMFMRHQELHGTEWFSSHPLSLCYLKSGNELHDGQEDPTQRGDCGDALGKDLSWLTAWKMGRDKWEMKTVLTTRVTGHQSQRIVLMYHTAPPQNRLLIEVVFLVTFPYFFSHLANSCWQYLLRGFSQLYLCFHVLVINLSPANKEWLPAHWHSGRPGLRTYAIQNRWSNHFPPAI